LGSARYRNRAGGDKETSERTGHPRRGPEGSGETPVDRKEGPSTTRKVLGKNPSVIYWNYKHRRKKRGGNQEKREGGPYPGKKTLAENVAAGASIRVWGRN